jgi:choline dehydrogenase-like flavoprotein
MRLTPKSVAMADIEADVIIVGSGVSGALLAASERISAIRFKRWDGSEGIASGKLFVLAAHGSVTPRLLLNLRSEATPNRVANSSDQVGRNLMDHPVQLSWALALSYRGPLSTLASRISATVSSAKTGRPSASSSAMTAGHAPKARPPPPRQTLRASVCARMRSKTRCAAKFHATSASPLCSSNCPSRIIA